VQHHEHLGVRGVEERRQPIVRVERGVRGSIVGTIVVAEDLGGRAEDGREPRLERHEGRDAPDRHPVPRVRRGL
jgi:hypothetical protein